MAHHNNSSKHSASPVSCGRPNRNLANDNSNTIYTPLLEAQHDESLTSSVTPRSSLNQTLQNSTMGLLSNCSFNVKNLDSNGKDTGTKTSGTKNNNNKNSSTNVSETLSAARRREIRARTNQMTEINSKLIPIFKVSTFKLSKAVLIISSIADFFQIALLIYICVNFVDEKSKEGIIFNSSVYSLKFFCLLSSILPVIFERKIKLKLESYMDGNLETPRLQLLRNYNPESAAVSQADLTLLTQAEINQNTSNIDRLSLNDQRGLTNSRADSINNVNANNGHQNLNLLPTLEDRDRDIPVEVEIGEEESFLEPLDSRIDEIEFCSSSRLRAANVDQLNSTNGSSNNNNNIEFQSQATANQNNNNNINNNSPQKIYLAYIPFAISQIIGCLTLFAAIVLYIIYYQYISEYSQAFIALNDIQTGLVLAWLIFWAMLDWFGLMVILEHAFFVKLYC